MLDFIINIKALNQDGVVIYGTATANNRDKHGESITISPNAFEQAITEYLKVGGKMLVDHGFGKKYGPKIIGKVLNAEYSPKDYSID